MGKIFVVRHGRYTGSGRKEALTSAGVGQCEDAAGLLSSVAEGPWQILSSDVPRAILSAGVIGRVLGQHNVVSSPLIGRAGDRPEDAEAFECRLATAMAEGGTEYNEELPLAVVGHLPLLRCVAGSPEAVLVYGDVLEYNRATWNGSAGNGL